MIVSLEAEVVAASLNIKMEKEKHENQN